MQLDDLNTARQVDQQEFRHQLVIQERERGEEEGGEGEKGQEERERCSWTS